MILDFHGNFASPVDRHKRNVCGSINKKLNSVKVSFEEETNSEKCSKIHSISRKIDHFLSIVSINRMLCLLFCLKKCKGGKQLYSFVFLSDRTLFLFYPYSFSGRFKRKSQGVGKVVMAGSPLSPSCRRPIFTSNHMVWRAITN